MERERQLGSTGINDKIPKMLADHPVVEVNQKTNGLLTNKREKVVEIYLFEVQIIYLKFFSAKNGSRKKYWTFDQTGKALGKVRLS